MTNSFLLDGMRLDVSALYIGPRAASPEGTPLAALRESSAILVNPSSTPMPLEQTGTYQRDRWNRTSRTYVFQLQYDQISDELPYVLTATFELTNGQRFFDRIILQPKEPPGVPKPATAPATAPSAGPATAPGR